jgi:hypothetical protein
LAAGTKVDKMIKKQFTRELCPAWLRSLGGAESQGFPSMTRVVKSVRVDSRAAEQRGVPDEE